MLLVGTSLGMMFACSGAGGDGEPEVKGQLSLPLVTQGPSGTTYRLRHATFVIQPYYYYDYEAAGAGGTEAITVSSETDPSAQTISLSVPEGQYYVSLQPGWSFEKVTPSGAEPVEATLLWGATQWVSVYRQSTSWAEFRFGIGDREYWLNGKLNIAIVVEEPYGEAGAAGYPSFPVAGAAGAAGSSEWEGTGGFSF